MWMATHYRISNDIFRRFFSKGKIRFITITATDIKFYLKTENVAVPQIHVQHVKSRIIYF